MLASGQSFLVAVTVEVDPDADPSLLTNGRLLNSATASGTDVADPLVTVSDSSDDPTNSGDVEVEGDNDPDDPTSIVMPAVELQKRSVGTAVPASSGVSGNFEVTYDLTIINTGSDELTSLSLVEDLAMQYGGAFVQIVGLPTVQASTASNLSLIHI